MQPFKIFKVNARLPENITLLPAEQPIGSRVRHKHQEVTSVSTVVVFGRVLW